MVLEKNIDVQIQLIDGNKYSIRFCEPESGDKKEYRFVYDTENYSDFSKAVGNELFSWVSLLMDMHE